MLSRNVGVLLGRDTTPHPKINALQPDHCESKDSKWLIIR